jgi:photosystem II stability/assembly factor-like uncharacterized protein
MQKLSLILICMFTFFFGNGQAWIPTNILPANRIDDISFVDDSIGFCGQAGMIYKSKDQGRNWEKLSENPDFGYMRSIHFLDSLTGFVGTLSFGHPLKQGLFMTKDGGKTFQKILEVGNMEGICGISHHENTVIAVGTFAGSAKIYISKDRGESFQTISLSTLLKGAVDCMMTDQNTIFVSGNSADSTGGKPMIIKSTDGGATWHESLFFNSVGAGYIWKMFMNQDQSMYASVEIFNSIQDVTDNVMFVSKDLGNTWNQFSVTQTKTVNYGGIAILPDGKGWIGDQHDFLFFETLDGGETWSRAQNGVPACNRMFVFKNGHVVAAGRTIYYYDETATSIPEEPEYTDFQFNIICHPNPVSDIFQITLKAESPTFGIVELYDMEGRLVYSDVQRGFDQGDTLVEVDVKSFRSGKYIVVWKNNHRMVHESFIKR